MTTLGKVGEDAAVNYLKEKGYKIAERNYNCKIAEIDIIAYYKDMLCFIEVKTRKNSAYGYPCEFVDRNKQHKIRLGAASYIKNKMTDCEVRFDVIEVYAYTKGENSGEHKVTRINHIENAFE